MHEAGFLMQAFVFLAAAVIAAACGPLPLALCWDWSGSYAVALILFGGLPLLSAVPTTAYRTQPTHRRSGPIRPGRLPQPPPVPRL